MESNHDDARDVADGSGRLLAGTERPMEDGRPPAMSSILSPFPPWKVPVRPEGQDQAPSPRVTRGLRHSPSGASAARSITPPLQPLPRPKRFNLRDGVQEAIEAITEKVNAKEMVVAEALFGFYSSEISLHFLHALSAYFISIAKEIAAHRRPPGNPPAGENPAKSQDSPRATRNSSNGAIEKGTESGSGRRSAYGGDGPLERAALLREVGRSYGRVVVYCSNFESTSADAMFFESFLCLARMVVAAAIAEPFLDAEIDKEFDRVLRGGVFHPSPPRPTPRPPRRARRSSPPERTTSGSRMTRSPGYGGTLSIYDEADHANRSTRELLSKGGGSSGGGRSGNGSRAVSASDDKNHSGAKSGGPQTSERRGPEAGTATASAVNREDISARVSQSKGLKQAYSSSPPSTAARKAASGNNRAFIAAANRHMGGAKRKGVPGASTNENEAENDTRGPETPPVFDDLPRWRVTSGPVFRMVRLAAQVECVALSNLALAEGYRRALTAKLWKAAAVTTSTSPRSLSSTKRGERNALSKRSRAKQSTSRDHPRRYQQPMNTEGGIGQHAESSSGSKSEKSSPLGKPAAIVSPLPWKRRGRALSSRKRDGAVHASDKNGRQFFNAEALSVCIASIVENTSRAE